MRLYDARHSFATNLTISGKKIKVVSEVMGSSVKTVMLHYSHVAETMHEEVLEDYSAKVIPSMKRSKECKEVS
jgi:Site-specific recombinase XerD